MNNVTYLDMLDDLCQKINEIDRQFIEPVKYDSDEEKVLRIIKGDFEYIFGISLEKFNEVYHNILKNCPEKLI